MEIGATENAGWKTWDQVAGVEKAGLENTLPKRMDGNRWTDSPSAC